MTRFISLSLFLCWVTNLNAQYLENFTGENGKGLVNAICPAGTTNISNCGSACTVNVTDNTSTCATVPPSFTGVDWTIGLGPSSTFFTDASGFGFEFGSPDDFGVIGEMIQVDDPDQEICWISPTLNIGAAGAVSIAIDVSQANLESGDYVRGDYSLNGGAYVTFETQSGAFAATQLNTSGLTGTTLSIRVCAFTNGTTDQIFIDNISVPEAGVTTGCAAPTLSTVVSQVGTCNPNSGAINLTVSGGTTPYTYSWSNLPGSPDPQDQTGLAAGVYTVTVTDGASCSATISATVTTATALSLSTQVLNADCPGAATGEIDLTVNNGVPPYSYSWSNLPGSPDPQDQTGLSAGVYTVTVTDAAGCTSTASATVSTAAAGAYSETFSIDGKGILDNSTCSGTNGTTCTNNNFVGVNWSIYGLSTLTGVDINDYFKTTGGKLEHKDIDQDVCWESPLIDINPPGTGVAFSVGLVWNDFDQEPSPDYIDVEYSLDGGSWTRVSNQVGGGTSGHTIVYANGSGNDVDGSTTVNVSGLSGSTLRIRVCGLANGETETYTIDNVSVPLSQSLYCPCPTINFTATPTNTCPGSTNGQIVVSGITGGTGPYMYSKDNGVNYQSGATFTGLAAGSYQIVVKDATACTGGPTSVNVGTFAVPTPTITGPTSVCPGGSVMLDAGAGFSSYAWSNAGGSSQTATFSNITSPTTYTVTVTNNGCTGTDTHMVTVNSLPVCSVTFTNPPPWGQDTACANTTGNIYSAPGGMSAYNWSISGSGTITSGTMGSSVTVTAGNSGSYNLFVTVTDANGCTSTCSDQTPIKPSPACTLTGPDPVCGNSTGNVYSVNNGSFPITSYSWSISGSGTIVGPTTGSSITVTAGALGTYTVSVTSTAFNACSSFCSKTVTINSASSPTITGPTSVCSGGSVMLDAGSGYTTYAWSNGGGSNQTATFTNITSTTTYTVTVTNNGCTGTDSHTVTVNPNPSCNVVGADFVCSNSTGNMYSAPGGMSAYSWGISGYGAIVGSTTGSSVTVTAGNYLGSYTVSVTITDANGCTSTCSKLSNIYLLTPPANITITPNPSCFGVTLDLSISAAASSTISWSGEGIVNPSGNPSTTAIPTTTGPHTYSVIVTTDYGCSNTGTASVTVYPLPTVGCPGNSSVCSNVPAYALTGGSPGGGVYSGPGVSAGMFNPATAAPGTHTITYTVTDGTTGCTNGCTFTIQVTSCTIDFSGKVVWEHNDVSGVKDATLNLTGSATGSDLTDVNGDFMIATSVSSGSFTLKPVKNLNKLNGVTVGDATAVQQHVGNITLITDNYKKVCADVNKSNSINTLDASLINQVILGNPAAHAQFNTSWRFVPTSHTMANPPWGFPEQRTYTSITTNQTGQDFIGMKIGDVTGDANPANFGSNATPSFVLAVKDEELSADTELFAEFKADQTDALAAFQFALRFDPTQLQLVEIQPMTGLPLTPDNFGTYNIAEGEIRVAWSQPTGVAVSEAAPVFRLKFKALQSGAKLSEVLQLDESELPALSYTDALAESKLEFKFSVATGTGDPADVGGVQLFQNRPNPFSGQTAIGFVLPRETEAQLRVYDVTGRMLFSQKKNYTAGKHEETLDLSGVTGVLWYELVTPFGVLSRKMTALR